MTWTSNSYLILLSSFVATPLFAALLFSLQKKKDEKIRGIATPVWSDYTGIYDLFQVVFFHGGSITDFTIARSHQLGAPIFFSRSPIDFDRIAYVLSVEDAWELMKFEKRLELEDYLPNSVFLLHGTDIQHAVGEEHSMWRRILGRAFTPKAIASYIPGLLTEFEQLWKRLATREDSFSLSSELKLTMFKAMANNLYGIDPSEEQLIAQLNRDYTLVWDALFIPPMGTTFKKAGEAADRVRAVLYARFKARLAWRKTNCVLHTDNDNTSSFNAMDFVIDALYDVPTGELRDLSSTDDDRVVRNLMFLLEAAYATTYYSMTAVFAEILNMNGSNRHCLERLRSEVEAMQGVFNLNTATTTMEYTQGCFHEALRLYPIVPFIGKTMPKDKEIELPSGYSLKGPCKMFIGISNHFKDEKCFKQCKKFLPERWIDSSQDYFVSTKNSFNPFGMGKHLCLGQKLAGVIMKVAIFSYFSQSEIELEAVEPVKRVLNIFPEIAVKNGCFVRVTRGD